MVQRLICLFALFQSSPACEGGCCDRVRDGREAVFPAFQSSPACEGGCCSYCRGFIVYPNPTEFQSSPACEGGCCLEREVVGFADFVSILTRL